MRTTVATLCLVLCVTTMAFGQESRQKTSQLHKGRVKMWTGVALLAAGLFVIPLPAVGPTKSGYKPSPVGVELAAAGGSLIWWGVRDQQKSQTPNTKFGVIVGRTNEIQIRRRW